MTIQRRKKQPGINIVIPNYNGASLLEENIPSLLVALNTTTLQYKIIVVDDCSTDSSIQFLVTNYPDIQIVENPFNQGFSKTCNNGIRLCSYKFTCVVNTDVTFDSNYFTNSLPYFNDDNLFAVKGRIYNYEDSIKNIINTEKTSKLYYSRGFLRFDQNIEPNKNPLTGKIGEQFVLLGCCFICVTEKLQYLQGFDERYSPFYWEDADLAFRALKEGLSLKYADNCQVFHKVSSTISNTQSKRKRRIVSIRNKFMFSWNHMPSKNYRYRHLSYVLLSLLTRWIILDWKYYYCFVLAMRQYNSITRISW